MLLHHLLASYRNLRKHKLYTAINVFGLAIGLASCLLIAAFLGNELSFDRFHRNSDNIYRLNTIFTDQSGTATKMANTPPMLVPGIRGAFPEIRKATQLRYAQRALLANGERRFYENHGFYADSLFLEIFSFTLTAGDAGTALDQPNTVVLTRELAAKYFGEADPMGNILTMNNDITLKVTGVLDPIPANSHLQFDFLVSFPTYEVPDGYLSDLTSWSWVGFLSYVMLHDGASARGLQEKLDQLYREKTSGNNVPYRTHVQPLPDIYLGSADLVDDLASGIKSGNRFAVYAFGTVALLILLITSFNFLNLSVAVAMKRRKQAALRKVLGAEKSSLVTQVLTESAALALISLSFAYALGASVFGLLKDNMGWTFSVHGTQVAMTLPFAVALALAVGIVAGVYPAVQIAREDAMPALKPSPASGKRTGSGFRRLLIAVQFFISFSLIAATFVITGQFQHLSDQQLGYDKENIAVVKLLRQDMTRHYETFKNRLLQNPHIISVSRGERPMGEPWPVNMILVDGNDESESKQMRGIQVGYDYLETMGIKLKEGRSFSKEFAGDSDKGIIITEKTAEYLSIDAPVGKRVHYFSSDEPRTIIGVVEDFNFLSLHHEISPAVLIMPFVDLEFLFVRFGPGNMSEKIAAVQDIWERTNPGVPLEYSFMDDQLDRLYGNEQKLSWLIGGFSGLAIVLACLGLYGLIAFTVSQSRKEMGIRKVLGASIFSLLIRFVRQYVVLIGVASLIAIPVIQLILSRWLENFAYRIDIGWGIYVMSLLALLGIAMVTISHQAVSAAMVNPVTVLKDE